MAEARMYLERPYPHTVTLGNGTLVTLRLMTAFDADRIVGFAKSLPADDLLHLRINITDPEIVKEWVRNLEARKTVTVIAEAGETFAGYAILHLNTVMWQRHLGEARILIAPEYRRIGLGRVLAEEIVEIAHDLELSKVVAQMMADQPGAQALFTRLGFQTEALLADFVIDRSGQTRDLIIMAYDVTGLSGHVPSA